ncbi:hypothetical protein KC19_VG078600 [Ceratodon purpureus]|uniref:DUF7869 domain-containing protein n=1 Tax=Ceratodon purpureus TaxID=3225 RepID=A0A8T0HN49_CERPU|nr:hypothetical protein KC19_VG078600 [Ceratodon purpureus]
MEAFSVADEFLAPQLPTLPDNVVTCEGLPRSSWITKSVTLVNVYGSIVAKGICHSIDSDLVIGSDGAQLGDDQVAVQIAESLCEDDVPSEWMFSLRAWHIRNVFVNGASLYDHDQVAIYNAAILGLSRTSFFRHQSLADEGVRADHHGNLGTKKPRTYTVQAKATLGCLLESVADQMPHRSRTLENGEKVVSMALPPSWKWKDSLPQVNIVNGQLGLRKVSLSGISNIRRRSFPEFSVKRPGDNFARCGTCDKLKSLKLASTKGTRAADLWGMKLQEHLAAQRAHRELYYANRYNSITESDNVVTVIHDKMDHSKTASPAYSHKNKATDLYFKLPLQVTGMIAHRHGDIRYAHYGLDIYPSDSNHTVGSLAKLLRDLESTPMACSGELFSGDRIAPLFQAVLNGANICRSSLPPIPRTPVPAKPLPPILNVQLDNACSDNKNRYMLCFFSLLVARGIFREVYVNFMLVGHTHDDIDALFGRWSMKLRKNDYPTIPLLMKSFMDAETEPVIPHFIEEVPDFKGFIDGHIASGDEALEGHTNAQHFKFYKHANGWPMMQYKIVCTDSDWLPKENGGIKLWSELGDGRPSLPLGSPNALPAQCMKNKDEIIRGIGGFINHWDTMANEDLSGEFRRRNEGISQYWKGVHQALEEDIISPSTLRDGFWPLSRFAPSAEDEYLDDGTVREAFAVDEPFIGQHRDRPNASFRVARDVFEGYFLIVRPADDDSRPFWVARAMSNPFEDSINHPNGIKVQYWKAVSTREDVLECYVGWNSGRSFQWEADEYHTPEWIDTDSLMTSWKSKIKPETQNPKVRIPVLQRNVISNSLVRF